jgi:hypothetical protein
MLRFVAVPFLQFFQPCILNNAYALRIDAVQCSDDNVIMIKVEQTIHSTVASLGHFSKRQEIILFPISFNTFSPLSRVTDTSAIATMQLFNSSFQ